MLIVVNATAAETAPKKCETLRISLVYSVRILWFLRKVLTQGMHVTCSPLRHPVPYPDIYPAGHTMPSPTADAQSNSMPANNLQSLENGDDVRVGIAYFLNSTQKPLKVTVTAIRQPYYEVIVEHTGQKMLVKLEHLYIDKTFIPVAG